MSEEGGSRTADPENTITFQGQTLTWRQVNARTWTQAQIDALVAEGRPPTEPAPFYEFNIASDFLAAAPASTVIRKQLWHTLAALPGVTLDGRAKDSLGRPGWRLIFTMPGWATQSVLVDTNTGMLLESNSGSNATTIVSAGPAATAPTPRPTH